MPIGRRVQLRGRSTGPESLDGLISKMGGRTEIKERISIENYVEVSGQVTSRGGVEAERIRARKASSQRGDDD